MNESIGIGDLAAILTATGLAIYVLGLIGLAIPIRRAFTGDISSAWYAVSLLPKTVVAGQGVRIWLRWPILIAALLLFTETVLRTLLADAYFLGYIPAFAVSLAPTIPWSAVRKALTTETWLSVWHLYKLVIKKTIFAVPPFFLGVIVLGTATELFELARTQDAVGDGTVHLLNLTVYPGDGGYVLKGVIALVIGSFFLGVPAATSATPPLPEIAIVKRPDEEEKGHEPLTGCLVAHSDGFWHLFDKNKELLSIPDDRVSSVRMASKIDAPTADKSMRGRLRRFFLSKDK